MIQIPLCLSASMVKVFCIPSRYNVALEPREDAIMPTNRRELPISEIDPQIAEAIANEERRQHEGLELIASENFVSEAVLEAAGSVFPHKYPKSYPGKRYLG